MMSSCTITPTQDANKVEDDTVKRAILHWVHVISEPVRLVLSLLPAGTQLGSLFLSFVLVFLKY
jgi:hypothetical protein